MKKISMVLLIVIGLGILAGCSYPADGETGAEETSVAETVAASVKIDEKPSATPTEEEDTTSGGNDSEEEEAQADDPTATPTGDDEGGASQIGDDQAEFIADVTIPDYSKIVVGEEITKTWRIRNTGTTTWTTGYVLEFEKGEKLGASTQITLPEEVKPGGMIDLSIDLRVPAATGEYSSYWILKNDDNEKVSVEEDGQYLSLYMVILAVNEGEGGESGDGGSSGSGSISGGANVTGASVTVTPQNFQGSCPADLAIQYTVTTSGAGNVQFNLLFNVVAPSGYTFDPPPQYLVDFSGGYTVYYDYLLFSADPVTATVRVQAIGSNEVLSDPVQFSVKCN